MCAQYCAHGRPGKGLLETGNQPLVNSPKGFLASLNKVFAMNKIWAVLVPRHPKVGRLPVDKTLIKKILAQTSQDK
jgi:hypothetical protein